MDKRGRIIVISGFSGAGKGTCMRKLAQEHEGYAVSVSVTTRQPRQGEQEGVDYYYWEQEAFDRGIEQDYFLEYARYVNNSYGTPRRFVEENLAAGRDVLLEIEIQGAMIIREKFPDTRLIFITAPSAAVLEERLTGRKTETPEKIRGRLERAIAEADGVEAYHYILVNDRVEDCVEALHRAIQEDGAPAGQQQLELIRGIQRELRERLAIDQAAASKQ